jgi:hypothetical protein
VTANWNLCAGAWEENPGDNFDPIRIASQEVVSYGMALVPLPATNNAAGTADQQFLNRRRTLAIGK